jgi:hypothetical protein
MPTQSIKSAAEYRERAKKLRLAAEISFVVETRHQLLVVAEDYEDLAESADLTEARDSD